MEKGSGAGGSAGARRGTGKGAGVGVRAEAHEEGGHAPRRRQHGAGDELDAASRQAAQLAPPPGMAQAAPLEPSAAAVGTAERTVRASLEDLLPALVRRVAWSGDGKRGAVRLELGAGVLAGGTLLVVSEGGAVRVHLQAPPGADADAWRARLASRLALKGLRVDDVRVD